MIYNSLKHTLWVSNTAGTYAAKRHGMYKQKKQSATKPSFKNYYLDLIDMFSL